MANWKLTPPQNSQTNNGFRIVQPGQAINLGTPEEQAAKEEINARSGWDNFGKGFKGGLKSIGMGTLQGGAHLGNSIPNFTEPYTTKGFPPMVSDEMVQELDDSTARQMKEQGFLTDQSKAAMAGGFTGELTGLLGTVPITRGVGNMAKMGRYGKYALEGLGGGLAMPSNSKDYASDKMLQGGVGAVGGVAFPPLFNKTVGVVSNIFKKFPSTPLLNEVGGLSPKGEQVMRELGWDVDSMTAEVKASFIKDVMAHIDPDIAKFAPREAARIGQAKSVGVDLTLGQASRDFNQQQFEQSMIKNIEIGEPLRLRKDEQNAALLKQLGSLRRGMGRETTDAYDAGEGLIKANAEKVREVQESVVAPAYKEITEKYGKEYIRPQAFRKQLGELVVTGQMKAVRNLIVPDKTFQYYVGLGKDKQKRIPLHLYEELRKKVGKYAETARNRGDDNEARVMDSLMDSIEKDVASTLGGDVYAPARAKAQARFMEDIQPFKEMTGSKVIPERLTKKVYSVPLDTLKGFKNSMLSGTGEQQARGGAAWNDYRGQVFAELLDGSLNTAQISRFDEPMFLVRNFSKKLKLMGNKRREMLFTPEENLLMDKIINVGTDRIPMDIAINRSGTAAELTNNLMRLWYKIPGAGIVNGLVKAGIGGNDASKVRVSVDPEKLGKVAVKVGKKEMKNNLIKKTTKLPLGLLGGPILENYRMEKNK